MTTDPSRRKTTPPGTGPRRGAGPASTIRTTARLALAPLSGLYGLAARLRSRRWAGRGRRLPHPVLSVGNLTFGGTGKTPFVIHACRELQRLGRAPAILSRGYRADGPGGNDEARVIARHLPDILHVQDPDRYAAGLSVADRADVYVLDDGFQHLPLHRDVDIVLVDATDPFGGGACPPGGRLREPLSALERATLVVLTRADLVTREALGDVMRTVRGRTAAPIATGRFRPSCPDLPVGAEVFVACGIGNPRAFVAAVVSLGARVAGHRFFRDHHAYAPSDVRALAAAGLPVVVTEKDAVKLESLWPAGAPPLHVVRVEFEAVDGAELVAAAIERVA